MTFSFALMMSCTGWPVATADLFSEYTALIARRRLRLLALGCGSP